MKKNNLTTSQAVPDYTSTCEVCEQPPTVIILSNGKNEYQSDLCGVCFFGTAQALDSDKWNNLD